MDELSLFLRICLGVVFLSSFISKLENTKVHILVVKDYRIVPGSMVPFLTGINMLSELVVGLSLIFGFMERLTSALAIFILLVYSFAIIVNLLRRRTEISCGCGGLNGNHHLSWLLVFRNGIFVVMSIWIFVYSSRFVSIQSIFVNGWEAVFQPKVLVTISVAVGFLLLYTTSNYLIMIKNQMKAMLMEFGKGSETNGR